MIEKALQGLGAELRTSYNRRDNFITPTLVECWRTAPYLRDGHWLTIKELLQAARHSRKYGEVDKLTEREVEDLTEFVLSL